MKGITVSSNNMSDGRLFLHNNFIHLRRIFPLFILLFVSQLSVRAQSPADSSGAADSVVTLVDSVKTDSVLVADTAVSKRPPFTGKGWDIVEGIPFNRQVLDHHPYFRFSSKALLIRSNVHIARDKDLLFYAIIGLVFLFAILRLSFPKYVNDLFRVFFRTTMKQRQIREQLMQTPLPSLMMNLFFVLTAGMYLNFLLRDQGFRPVEHFWFMYLYCCAGLAIIYFVKFLGLKICGWIFNIKNAAESYIFIVFIINKMIGIFLLPVVVILGFAHEPLFSIVMVLSWCGIGMLLLYRFVLAFSAVRNEVRFNLFHFILYFAAFEVGPLLLIYRVLLSFV
ncbi:MAG: DUF4271 domain-containing protein [Chitinophagaceae bacterium]|nr:MAG: DUF4271 domain-containing protein [Chitinophagaceae bacterium]